MSTRQTLASLLRHRGPQFSFCTRCPLPHSLAPQGASSQRQLSSSSSASGEQPFVRPGVLANIVSPSLLRPKATEGKRAKPIYTGSRDTEEQDARTAQRLDLPLSSEKKTFGSRSRDSASESRPLVRRRAQPTEDDEGESEQWRGGRRPDWQPGWKSRYTTAPDALKYDPRIQLGRTTTVTPAQTSPRPYAKPYTPTTRSEVAVPTPDPAKTAALEYASSDSSRHVPLDTALHSLPKVSCLPKKGRTRVVGWSGVQLENILQPMASTPHAVYRSAYFLLRAAPLSVLPVKKALPFPESRIRKREEPKVVHFAYTATKAGVSKLATVRNRARGRMKAAVDLVVNRSMGLREGEHGWDLVSPEMVYIGQVSVDILGAPLPILIEEVAAALRDLQAKAGKHQSRAAYSKKKAPWQKS